METSRERVISVSLNETEWQAFIQLHPQPVSWLRERIQESINDRPGLELQEFLPLLVIEDNGNDVLAIVMHGKPHRTGYQRG